MSDSRRILYAEHSSLALSDHLWIGGDERTGVVAGWINLVSVDGKQLRQSGTGEWLAVTWSRDGALVLGLRQTPGRELELVSLNPQTGNRP